ncbi:hypothetical protein vseg_015868 [Gypsophila vaccaria]
MAYMSIFPGNSEIIEIEEESNPGLQYRGNNVSKKESRREDADRRFLASTSGNRSSLEEDLNQLFEIFNRRASHGSPHQNEASTSKRNASKMPVKAGGSHSPGPGMSERVNLKQALRGLCLSQASEMAAKKRSVKSPHSSKPRRIMTMYQNAAVEDSRVSDHSRDDNRGGMLEISLVPEQTPFVSFQNVPEKLPSPDLWPSNRSSLVGNAVGRTTVQNDSSFESMDAGSLTWKSEKPDCGTSSASVNDGSNIPDIGCITAESSQSGKCPSPDSSSCSSYVKSDVEHAIKLSSQKDFVSEVVVAGNLEPEEDSWPPSCSDDTLDKVWDHNKSSMTAVSPSQPPMTKSLHNDDNEPSFSFRSSCEKTSFDIFRRQENAYSVSSVERRVEDSPSHSPHHSDFGAKVLFDTQNSAASSKVASTETAEILANVDVKKLDRVVQKGSSKSIPGSGSPRDKKTNISTRNSQNFVKPLIKTKHFARRRSKKKMIAGNSSKSIHSELNSDLYSTLSPIVCPRCQCNVTDARKEVNKESPLSPQESLVAPQESPTYYQDSPISPLASQSEEVSSGNVISDVSTPGPSSDGLSTSKSILVESSSKSRHRSEFTQSSKSSPDECSSSSSVSEGSNLSRPSFCDRPHMSKDIRWEAIRQVKFQHGTLGLSNFSLLKKLGCGDIGTVYLAELIGTNCLFAIKVMDNVFLSRRKKITRAQTEKEILRMLDHPFLPTLYCQFTSDNLSCLVMEYCPGGDLHVLRQRQPGRCFTEHAARFYVAEVLLALEYLHMLGVVYRDLKPENILVREDGHIMLSDFDLSLRCAVSPTLLVTSSISDASRKISHDSRPCVDSHCAQPLCLQPSTCFTPRLLTGSSKPRKTKIDIAAEMRPLLQLVAEPTTARSNSFVGTHEYLSPEIIKGEGHGSAVDWWTFGIFLYELLYGRTPFKGPGNEETLANVVLQTLKFPDSPLVSLQARDLIAALLVKEPENRLGTERGAAEIKQHPFFDGLNWALIRCAAPPELPEPLSYGTSKVASGCGSTEQLEFEVF